MRGDSAETFFQSLLQEPIVSSSGMGRDVPSLMLSIQHFLCRPRRRPTIQSALKDGFGEVVVAYDMPEPCQLPSPDSL